VRVLQPYVLQLQRSTFQSKGGPIDAGTGKGDLLQEGTRRLVLMGGVVFFVVSMLSVRYRGRGS